LPVLDGDQLLGGKLLDPFRINPFRQMDIAIGPWLAFGELFIGRSIKPQ